MPDDDHESGPDDSTPDSSPAPSDSGGAGGGGGDDDREGGPSGSDDDKSKARDADNADEKDANKAGAPEKTENQVDTSAKTDKPESSEGSAPILLMAGQQTNVLYTEPPNGSIPIGQPPTQSAALPAQGNEAKTFSASGGVLGDRSPSIGPQAFNSVASAAELKSGAVATGHVEVEGEKIPAVAIYDADRQQLSVVRDGVLGDGTRIADIVRVDMRTGDVSAWDATTGVTTVFSRSGGNGTQSGKSQSGVSIGGLGLEFVQPAVSGKGLGSTPSPQAGGIPLALNSVEKQQYFGIGSDAEKPAFSSSERMPFGVEPKTRSFRAERSVGGVQGVGASRPERRVSSSEAARNAPHGIQPPQPSRQNDTKSASNLPSTHLSRASIPPVAQPRPPKDLTGVDTLVKGAKDTIGSYVALTEAAEMIEAYLAYAELAELAGASAFAATGVLLLPGAVAVAAGMGVVAGIAGIGFGTAQLIFGASGLLSQDSVDTSLAYGSALGLAGGIYGVLTDPDKANDYAKEWSEMEDLKDTLGL